MYVDLLEQGERAFFGRLMAPASERGPIIKAFHGRLHNGNLVDITDGDDPKAKIALSLKSDDFLALVRGDLDLARALASGQMRIKANPFDLLKLRRLL